MKVALMAALACFALALTPDVSFAQKKEKMAPAKVGTACLTAGQTCSIDCNPAGYCARLACENAKWKKRVVGCFGPACPPKC